MNTYELQDLMDRAWDLAVERASNDYGIDAVDGEYSNSDHQVVNALQTEIFLELGGDLDLYYDVFC